MKIAYLAHLFLNAIFCPDQKRQKKFDFMLIANQTAERKSNERFEEFLQSTGDGTADSCVYSTD